MKFKMNLIVPSAVLVALSLGLLRAAEGQDALPDAPGRDTLLLACTQCHSLGKMFVADLTADDWQFIVYDMISRGAPVHQQDIAELTKYLQDNFATDTEKQQPPRAAGR